MAVIVVEKGRHSVGLVLRGPAYIGRVSGLDVVLKTDGVSRMHARIGRDGDRYFVEDLGSRNGTFVNQKKIAGRQNLDPGDLIRVGKAIISFRELSELPHGVESLPALDPGTRDIVFCCGRCHAILRAKPYRVGAAGRCLGCHAKLLIPPGMGDHARILESDEKPPSKPAATPAQPAPAPAQAAAARSAHDTDVVGADVDQVLAEIDALEASLSKADDAGNDDTSMGSGHGLDPGQRERQSSQHGEVATGLLEPGEGEGTGEAAEATAEPAPALGADLPLPKMHDSGADVTVAEPDTGHDTGLIEWLEEQPEEEAADGEPDGDKPSGAGGLRASASGDENAPPRDLGVCSVCHSPVTTRQQHVVCESCKSPYHSECWTTMRGCSTYGCDKVNVLARQAQAGPVPSSGRESEARKAIRNRDDSIPWDWFFVAAGVFALLAAPFTAGVPSGIILLLSVLYLVLPHQRKVSRVAVTILLLISVLGIAAGVYGFPMVRELGWISI